MTAPTPLKTLRLGEAALSALECSGVEMPESWAEAPELLTVWEAWGGRGSLTVTAETREALAAGITALANAESESVGVGGGSMRAWRALTALAGKIRRSA